MSRGRPHRRFRRPLEDAGPESTRRPCHVPRERCVQPRALANTLLREPLITHPRELTSAFLFLFLLPRFKVTIARLASSSSLRPGYQISCSFSDVHGSQLPPYSSDVYHFMDGHRYYGARVRTGSNILYLALKTIEVYVYLLKSRRIEMDS